MKVVMYINPKKSPARSRAGQTGDKRHDYITVSRATTTPYARGRSTAASASKPCCPRAGAGICGGSASRFTPHSLLESTQLGVRRNKLPQVHCEVSDSMEIMLAYRYEYRLHFVGVALFRGQNWDSKIGRAPRFPPAFSRTHGRPPVRRIRDTGSGRA